MTEKEFAALEGISFPSTSTYTMLQEIGRGGMGIVYLAERNCEGVTDIVVLKTIKTLSNQYVEMLKKEANIATNLRHENIVKTYGLEAIPAKQLPTEFQMELQGLEYSQLRQNPRKSKRLSKKRPKTRKVIVNTSDEEKLYLIAMDYVDGLDLGSLFREHRRHHLLIPPILTAFIMSRICRALHYAHKMIIHRDISPENIMVDNKGVCKLSDFGIAVGGEEQIDIQAGKLGYIAPEQLQQQQCDSRSDIFSLGVVGYLMLTGINLFATPLGLNLTEQIEYVKQKHQEEILPPHKAMKDVPEILSAIIMKMLALDPSERYQDAEKIGNDLEQRYMYASGFGPTNNSMAAYIEIFKTKFQEYDRNQLQQLRFLKNDLGKIRLHRSISPDNYTEAGLKAVKKYRGTRLYKMLFTETTT